MLASFRPVICTSRLGETRAFYAGHFGLEVVREAPWYLVLGRPAPRPVELTLVDPSHPEAPEEWKRPVRAVRIVLEADTGGGRTVVDPNGVRVDVVPIVVPIAARDPRGEVPWQEESIPTRRSR
ncbi:glyoxalase [Kitasatospora sp. NPDC058162]|uniref:glyoxalase n=1 Tax=Kitasatospora sp. NPDC058162 TaxID=3346362 RepID=UPI0036DEB78C